MGDARCVPGPAAPPRWRAAAAWSSSPLEIILDAAGVITQGIHYLEEPIECDDVQPRGWALRRNRDNGKI